MLIRSPLLYRSVAVATFWVMATTAQAKGLDQLTPAVEKPEDSAKEDKTVKSDDKSNPGETPTPNTVKPSDAANTAATTEAGKTPGAVSKKIAKKLYFATGLGYASITKKGNNWNKGGAGDIAAGYLISPKFMGKSTLFATFRYAPFEVVPKISDHSYRGVVETYNFGVLARFPMKTKLTAIATAEAGYATVNLRSADNIPERDDEEKNGGIVTIGGGAEWTFFEKLTVGPRLYVGFGSYQTVAFTINGGFIF